MDGIATAENAPVGLQSPFDPAELDRMEIAPSARNTALAAVVLALLYGFDLARSHTFRAACDTVAAGQLEDDVNTVLRTSGGRRYGFSDEQKIWYRPSVIPHRSGECTVSFDGQGRSTRAEYATVWSLSR